MKKWKSKRMRGVVGGMNTRRNLIRCGRSLGEYQDNGIKRYLVTNGGLRSLLTEYEYRVWNEVRELVSLTDFDNRVVYEIAYKEAISRLVNLKLLIQVEKESMGVENCLYLTRNGAVNTSDNENRIITTLMSGVSYDVTEEQYHVWREATGKARVIEMYEKLRQTPGIHKQTMYRLMTTIKLLVDYRLCELEYWKSEGENRSMKREVMVGVGEGLGRLNRSGDTALYGVNYAGERYELEESVYRVWELAKKGQYKRDEFSEKLGIGKANMDMYISCLAEVNMVLNWGYHIEDGVLETHTLVSKGLMVGKEEENYLFKEVQEGFPYTLPIVPATVWKLSDPFTNKTITRVIDELVELTGYSQEEARYEVIGWTPYLVGCGLLVIDGIKGTENESTHEDKIKLME